MNDSFQQLMADMAQDVPDAVEAARDGKVIEFLEAAVKYARLWRESDDPWLGIACLTQAIIAIADANRGMEKEIAVSKRPVSIVEGFME